MVTYTATFATFTEISGTFGTLITYITIYLISFTYNILRTELITTACCISAIFILVTCFLTLFWILASQMVATSTCTFIFEVTCVFLFFQAQTAHDANRTFTFTTTIWWIITIVIVFAGTTQYTNVHADIAFDILRLK